MGDLVVAVVVDYDEDIRNLLEAVLQQAGFEVYCAANGLEAVSLIRREDPSVVILDIALPDIDGFEVLRRIRMYSQAYVVVLTGRTDESDVLTSFHVGADDYVTKPFKPRELRVRIAAMLRRPRGGAYRINPDPPLIEPGTPDPASMHHNGLTLNPKTRSVTVGGDAVGLSRREFDILHELIRRKGAVCARADLARVLRTELDEEDAPIRQSEERSVEVHVGNLRQKLGEDPKAPRWLQTVRGIGYRLAPDQSAMHD
ncbi:response regulator transcription factor [Arthrobacter alkaliphilus]|uniref:response regulator transcription factor n=1 Tax=Arthrobacter alkaliphilus TaxID=369936 RepID=UPI001F1EE783|nr:response regulator transcription factor [Arthrobacter alkaliphilus]